MDFTRLWRNKALIHIVGVAWLVGCSSSATHLDPDSTYLDRSVEQSQAGLSVIASVLTDKEVKQIFNAPLNSVGIQPVWLKIQNLSAYSYVLLLRSVDPDYFSPYEVARRVSNISAQATEDIYSFVRDMEIQRFITPGAEVEGYVYTHQDEGIKSINVSLFGNKKLLSFHMAVDVPGLTTDFADLNLSKLYDKIASLPNENDLRIWLEALPCCTATLDGTLGDPLNLVFVGNLEDIKAALVSQHWDVTAEINRSSFWRITRAFIFGSRYRYAPISKLYLFGREQDITFQKARAVIDERNHIRLWLAPVSYKGKDIWVGHISRDAGIKMSGRFWPPTTHVIDPAVDEARFYIEQDLLYSQRVQKIGLVGGVEAASPDKPRTNAEGDPYFTDGLRAVFFVGNRLVALDGLEVLNWRLPAELEPFRKSVFE